jgi:glutamyl/glutaminyl-tRNA synthetase
LLSALLERWERRPADAPAPTGAEFKSLLGECGRELGLKGRELFQPARAALSGRTHGPELPLLFEALGAERARVRIQAAAGR